MNNKKFSLSELDAMTIFQLRDLAKDFGVPAPTKMCKKDLENQIYQISNGMTAPPATPRRGRPPKAIENMAVDNSVEENKNVEEKQVRENKQNFEKRFKKTDWEQSKYGQRKSYDNHNAHAQNFQEPAPNVNDEEREGILEIHPDGYGFLRVKNCDFNEKDAYVNAVKLRKLGLRSGDSVKGIARQMQDGKPAALLSVQSVNGIPYEKLGKRPNFDHLVPVYPNKRFKLESLTKSTEYATRCIDLIAPIGKGQRAMIVSPPKAGKTTLLKMIASSISENYPEAELMVLLIDERPEEVTDMQRSIKGEVVYSTFDEQPEHHTRAAELLLDRAKRLVELGKDVVILMDSLTRLARAYNMTIPPTGRTLSGGIDPGALHSPKKFFGAARNIENGGSLTIIATALVDTGSRMDDVIFEEFKGTGNMEIHLDRKLSEKRIFPAIDLAKSGTRKEELLLSTKELGAVWAMRKILSIGDSVEATETLLNRMVKTKLNAEFIDSINGQMKNMDLQGFTFIKSQN